MRSIVFFIAASVFFIPLSTDAAFSPLVSNKGCTAASAGDPTSEKSFSFFTAGSEVKSYLDAKVTCPSACFDEVVTLDVTSAGIRTVIKGVNKCTKTQADPRAEDPSKDKRGCATGLTKPHVVVILTGAVRQVYPAKSRCDSANLSALIDSVASKDYKGALAALERLADAPEPVPELPGGVTGNQALVDAYKQLNYTEEQANAIIKKDAVAAADYINAIARDDKEAIAASAKKLGLNPEISDAQQRAVLEAVEESAPTRPDASPTGLDAPDTFTGGHATEIEKAKCAISTKESGSCAGNYGAIGPPTRSGGRAYGRYQVMDVNIPSWTARACGRAMNPYQFLGDGDCQEKVFEATFGGYMASCGSFEGAASKWFSGRCGVTNSNDGYTSVPKYVQDVARVFYNGKMPFGAAATPYVGGVSPFSRSIPYGVRSPYDGGYTREDVDCDGGGYCYLRGGSGAMSYAQPPITGSSPAPIVGASPGGAASPTSGPSSGGSSGSAGGSLAPPVLPTPVASLIVQPRESLRGDPVVVSWSTVGMNLATPCRVIIATTSASTLALGNEGTKTITLGTAGTYRFTLECKALSGIDVRQATSVLVK